MLKVRACVLKAAPNYEDAKGDQHRVEGAQGEKEIAGDLVMFPQRVKVAEAAHHKQKDHRQCCRTGDEKHTVESCIHGTTLLHDSPAKLSRNSSRPGTRLPVTTGPAQSDDRVIPTISVRALHHCGALESLAMLGSVRRTTSPRSVPWQPTTQRCPTTCAASMTSPERSCFLSERASKQLLGPSTAVKKLVAIDKDVNALAALRADVAAQGSPIAWTSSAAASKRSPRPAMPCTSSSACTRWTTLSRRCSMPSRWLPTWWCTTTLPVRNGSTTARRKTKSRAAQPSCRQFGIRRQQTFQAEQRFANYDELYAKVAPQGPLAIERALNFVGAKDIVIPFSYELNLL